VAAENKKLKKDKWLIALYASSYGSNKGKKFKNYTHKSNSEATGPSNNNKKKF